MSYLIILLVIAVALAPLSHFVPTKAQRKVARLREYAAIHGLFVEFRDVPRPKSQASAVSTAHTIYYGRRARGGGRGPERRLVWLWGENGWTGLPRREPVAAELAALPGGILAASADQDSCGIYWQESGDEAEIDQICSVLEALAERLYQ